MFELELGVSIWEFRAKLSNHGDNIDFEIFACWLDVWFWLTGGLEDCGTNWIMH